MFQVSIISAVRSAVLAAGLLGVVAAGIAIRGAAPADVPSLGLADDFGTRHPSAAVELTRLDDFGTRYAAQVTAVELTRLDDFGTRYAAVSAPLTRADDYGTRHSVEPAELGPADDYGTRHQR